MNHMDLQFTYLFLFEKNKMQCICLYRNFKDPFLYSLVTKKEYCIKKWGK
jgi:hypothetical protein